jgi:mannose/fructose/N-acetylgalactosamine-specific phosphotransferase system component IIB
VAVEIQEYRLFRVDDRLLHGQVTLGWGRRLGSCRFVLADDRLASHPEEASLYAFSAPPGSDVIVIAPDDLLAERTPLPPPVESVLLVRDLRTAALLLRGGVPGPLDLGGIHMHEGARQIFTFLFLTAEEEGLVSDLLGEGHAVYAQDLPTNRKHDAAEWLRPVGERP